MRTPFTICSLSLERVNINFLIVILSYSFLSAITWRINPPYAILNWRYDDIVEDDPGKSGFFAKRAEKGSTLIFVDDLSADWLRIKAAANHTTPEAIIKRGTFVHLR